MKRILFLIKKTIKFQYLFVILGSLLWILSNNLAAKEIKKLDKTDKDKILAAKELSNPTGCENDGYKFTLNTLTLLPEKRGLRQSMYLFYNKSSNQINLFHMRKTESTENTYLNHILPAKQWSVLSTGEKTVNFICTIPNKNLAQGKIVSCAANLKLCEFTNVRYGLNNRGDFWLANNPSKNAAVMSIVHYGIIPDAKPVSSTETPAKKRGKLS